MFVWFINLKSSGFGWASSREQVMVQKGRQNKVNKNKKVKFHMIKNWKFQKFKFQDWSQTCYGLDFLPSCRGHACKFTLT